MKHIFTFFIFLLLAQSLRAQKNVNIQVFDDESKEPISYALVHNRTDGSAFICDEKANLQMTLSDSILIKISAISYEDYFFFVNLAEEVDTLKFYLSRKTYELTELVVHPYPTKLLFKKAFVNLDLPDTNQMSPHLFMDPDLKAFAQQAKEYQGGDFLSISLGSPISGIYNLLSQREQSKRKLQKLLQNDKRESYLHSRYNEDFVRQLLGIQQMKKIEAFMEYCQPDNDFLLAATDYELACYVLNCYQSFLLNQPE